MNDRFVIFHLDDGKELRGGQRQALYLASELNKSGYRNIMVCRKNSPLEKASSEKNLEILNLPYIFEWDIISAFMLATKIKKLNTIPILHSHTAHTAAISYLTSLFCRVARIVHRRVDFKIKKSLSSRAKYSKADKIIALSKAIKRLLVSGGVDENKISLIPSATDIANVPWITTGFKKYKEDSRREISEKFNIKKDSFWIGSLIALVPHKDPENFIKSAKIVLDKYPRTHFILAGKGELSNKLKNLARRLNIESNFHIVGYYSNFHELLSALDLFVLPSKEEGLGSVLIEAMNAKLPIVATNAGGITDLIENEKNGLTVEKKKPEELARAQIKLIEDENLKNTLAEEGYKRRNKFSSEKMAEATLKIYDETIKNASSY